MNILQVLPSLDIGGVETGTIDLAKYLVSRGHKAITISSGGRLVRELDAIGARHYNLPIGKKSLINIIRMIKEVCEIIRREDIDIVHARSRVPALIAYIACKASNKAFLTTAHGYYRKHLMSEAMGWGKYVIVASNIMAKHMVNNFKVPYDRIRLIPRGVDLEWFTFRDPSAHSPAGFTVGMVSRITPLKGHADFVRAIAILNRQIPNLHAVIVGEAPKSKYKEDLELLIRRLGLSNTIEFLSATNDVPNVMKKLDVLVSATITPEAFGRVIIEAQASGVPVVATQVGGVVDIIEDSKTGLLCSPQNPKDMAEKVLKLYKDRALWMNLAIGSRRHVESYFNLEKMMEKTLAVYEEALATVNILVIKISAIGDVILSVPSLKAIRAKYPRANIKVLVGVQSREALDGCPYINERIVCDLKGRHRGIFGLWRLGKELRSSCFDIAIDLQNSKRSHLLAALSLAPLRYGYDNKKLSFLLNRRLRDDAPYLDPIEHQFRTLRMAAIKPQEKCLELWPSPAEEDRAEKLLTEGWMTPSAGLVGVNVRASSRWVTKNWPVSYIAELSDRLAKEFNVRTVLTGAEEDIDFAQAIARSAKSKPLVAAGKTSILELASLIRRFKVYLTPDSAPMHIAAAMGTPCIALFGPTNPERHVPPSGTCMVISKKDELKCSPCYNPNCVKNFVCMKKITVDEVLEAMRPYLKEGV
ncbi:MAG: lipopolysaccharide heptosyltransferase II [Candidatus Omnitrophica bacterium]|nr:lipopolysaccharide heptosyltransferase II [Candidatus Omnitrophota bacterium]MDD5436089.1 lipopolysaccharide heptosyltransferase II [Candidatus Omnitrophota bacterium]